MKEQLYTIPLMDAFREKDECPFCFIHRSLEQHAIDFTLGSGASYLEDDIRFQTDKAGFCKDHYQKMFLYGNRLGSALILETHLKKLTKDLKEQMEHYSTGDKPSLLGRLKKSAPDPEAKTNNVSTWIRMQNKSCYICEQIETTYERYLATFFELFKRNEDEFMDLLKNGKGFCLPHFGDLLSGAERYLNEKDQARLREILFPQMIQNLERITGDVEWFQKKFDYQFKDADWKDAKDAVQRAMQKAGSGYPADPPYIQK